MKALDEKTLDSISDLICGDGEDFYRKGRELDDFFRNAGLNCIFFEGTRKWWTLDRLREYNRQPQSMEKVLVRLTNPKEYGGNQFIVTRVIEKLNNILAIEGYKVVLKGIIPSLLSIDASTVTSTQNIPFSTKEIPFINTLIGDPSLQIILHNRCDEAVKCVKSEAYLSSIIMMGSFLEGFLLAIVSSHPRDANTAKCTPKLKDGSVKLFGDWYLWELIEVSHCCGWIQRDAKEFSQLLRDYRNLVHPWEQRMRSEIPDRDTCSICWEVIIAAVNDVVDFFKS